MDFLKQSAKEILRYEARQVLKKYKPKIIAITGSVGKTSTREAIYVLLSKKFFVRKNEKSFTADLGVPMAILGCSEGISTLLDLLKNIFMGFILLLWKGPYPQWLILEIDGDKPGDLPGVSDLLSIDILVMTAIGDVPSHIESFSNLEVFMAEKRALIQGVKRDGVIIFNSDDNVVSNIVYGSEAKKVSCSIGGVADVVGSQFNILYGGKEASVPTGITFDISYKDNKNSVSVFDSIGVHYEYAFLLSFAVGIELGLPENEIISSLCKFKSLKGRMKLITGIKNSFIIDDSYNSSPIAMSQAIDAFNQIRFKGKKIVVVGDMMELGKYSADEHKKVADLLKNVATNVICVGIRSRKISEELLDQGFNELNIISVDNAEQAGLELQKIIQEGDIVLIKGSQSMRMEKIVEEVMRHPEDKKKLLVRQEKEWLLR